MKNNRRIIVSIIWVILGVTLFGLGIAGIVDEFWNSMGFALTVVGILQLIRFYRFRKDEDYREKIEIEVADERNRYIRNKAWAWAGYLFILVTAAGIIVLRVLGQDVLSMAASCAVCFMLILYWGSYMVLKRKY